MKKIALYICRLFQVFIPRPSSSKTSSKTVQHVQVRNDVFLPLAISYLETKNSVTIPLKGYSMRPFLESDRDTAVLIKPHAPVLNEPVLVEADFFNRQTNKLEKRWILHRIVGINGEDLTLLGDGNLRPEHCKVSDIKASIKGFYRKGRSEMDLITGRKWRIYSFFWTRLLPIRRYLLFFHRNIFT